MRIRSTLAGLALGVGALFLTAAPAALADTQPSPTASPASSTTQRPAEPTARPVPSATVRPGQRPAVERGPAPSAQVAERPRGAAETGAGMDDASSTNTGMMVVGGVALVALAGGGTVAFRRLRKQS